MAVIFANMSQSDVSKICLADTVYPKGTETS